MRRSLHELVAKVRKYFVTTKLFNVFKLINYEKRNFRFHWRFHLLPRLVVHDLCYNRLFRLISSLPEYEKYFGSTIIHFKRKETIMKTFSEISNQLERIYKLYLKGFGTKKMLETAERFFNSQQNIGLCF